MSPCLCERGRNMKADKEVIDFINELILLLEKRGEILTIEYEFLANIKEIK